MGIDDGEVIAVAARVKVVKRLTGQSMVPKPEVRDAGIARIADERLIGYSDHRLSAMAPEVGFCVNG
jgi:hypothetical protein